MANEARRWHRSCCKLELILSAATKQASLRSYVQPSLVSLHDMSLVLVGCLWYLDVQFSSDKSPSMICVLVITLSIAGHEPTVKLLSTRGANPLAVDSTRKRNAVQWAAFNDHLEVRLLLLLLTFSHHVGTHSCDTVSALLTRATLADVFYALPGC